MLASSTALVLGADQDLGYRTVRLLAAQGAFVIAHADNLERGEIVLERLVKDGVDPLHLELVCADFSDLAQVAAVANRIRESYLQLSLLVAAKSTAGSGERMITVDGNERTFQINYVAPYLLTRMLQDLLTAAPGSRVVTRGSVLYTGGSISWTDINRTHRYSQLAVYAQSMLALAMFTRTISRYWDGSCTAVCVDPGSTDRELLRLHGPSARPREDAPHVLAQICAPDFPAVNGTFYDGLEPGPVAPVATDERAQARLWKRTAGLTGLV